MSAEPATIEAGNADVFAVRPRTGTCTLSLDGVITWGGSGCGPLFGPTVDSIVGTAFTDLWLRADHDSISNALAAARSIGSSIVSGHSAVDRLCVEASIDLRRGASGESIELIVSMRSMDVNTLSQDERILFDAIPVALWITHEPDGNRIYGNPVTEKRYGFAPGSNVSLSQQPVKRHDRYRCYKDGKEISGPNLPVQRACRGEHVRDEVIEIRAKDGDSKLVLLHASPLRDAAGAIVGSICVETDITEHKRFERTQQLLLECSRLTGPTFFPALTLALSKVLGVRQVYIAEITEEDRRTLRTIAAHVDGEAVVYGDFIPHGTPCAEVMSGATVYVPSGALERYPNAPVLREMNGESYVGTPLLSPSGDVIGVIGVSHDKPMDPTLRAQETVQLFAGRAAAELQRLRSDAKLRKSEEKYRIITDVIPSLVAFIDADQRYQFANAAYKRWFGLDPELMKGRQIKSVISPEAYARASPYIRRALRGERVTYENYVSDSIGPIRHIQAEYVPQVSDDGRVTGFFAFIIDISDRKEHEEALSRSEARFRVLFEQLPIGVAMVDLDGNVLLENEVLSKLLPPTANAADSTIFQRTCAPAPDDGDEADNSNSRPHPIREALQGHVSRDEDVLCEHPDGQKRWVKTRGIPIRGASDEIVGALMVADDIHNEKLAEERRRLLINELNHRVKNTLAGVQSIASQTFRGSNFTPAALEAFEERLLALANVHNLLTYEGWEGTDMKRLAVLVMEPHNPGADRLRIDGPNIRLKPQAALALAMALHELATNAVKYGSLSRPGGTLRISWGVTGEGMNRRMQLKWVERGGPPVSPPVSKGFGTRLIERSLAFELDSASSIRFEPDGVVCEINADLREIVG